MFAKPNPLQPVVVYFSRCQCTVVGAHAPLFYVSLSLAHGGPAPASSQVGDSGANKQVHGIQQAQVQDHQPPGRRNRKFLESAPLIQTILHGWGLSKYPLNKRWHWQDFSTRDPGLLVLPSLRIGSLSAHLLISIFTFHYAPALPPHLLPSPFSPPLKNTFLSGTENKLRLWVVMLI